MTPSEPNERLDLRVVVLMRHRMVREGIALLLRAEGIRDEVVESALASLEPERERARRIVARLGPSARTAGRLARKGFGDESVEEAVGGGFAVDGPEA